MLHVHNLCDHEGVIILSLSYKESYNNRIYASKMILQKYMLHVQVIYVYVAYTFTFRLCIMLL